MSSTAELKGKVSLNDSEFKTKLAGVRQGVSSFASGALSKVGGAVAAAFGVVEIGKFALQMAAASAETKRGADALGMSSGMMEELKDMAEATGASAEGFQQKIAKMTDSQEQAVSGNKEAQEAFARLGVSMQDLQSMTPEQLLKAVADGAQTDALAISDLNKVMGRGAGSEFNAVLKQIAEDGMPSVTGAVNDQIEAFAALNARWKTFKDNLSHIGMGLLLGAARLVGLAPSQDEAQAEAKKKSTERDQQNKQRLAGLKIEAEEKAAEEKAKEDKKKGEKRETLEKRQKELFKDRDSIKDSITVAEPKAADSMAKMGFYMGGQNQNAARMVSERQLKELEKIAEWDKKHADQLTEIDKDLKELREG